MDWSKQRRKSSQGRGREGTQRDPSPQQRQHRSRSNSFVLSQIFDASIERESQKKDIPTHAGNGGGEILHLQDIEYDFGSEWLVKSPEKRKKKEKKKVEDDVRERKSLFLKPPIVNRDKGLPPIPLPRKGRTAKPKSKSVIARRVSLLPTPVTQKPEPSGKKEQKQQSELSQKKLTDYYPRSTSKQRNRDVQTQTESESTSGETSGARALVSHEILKDIRLCSDLLQEMIESACDLSEIYEKERKRSRSRQKSCCTIC